MEHGIWYHFLKVGKLCHVDGFSSERSQLVIHRLSIRLDWWQKGFKHQHGVDFEEIFLPVVKLTTICVLLGLAASQDLEMVHMDIKIAFLHGDLDEEIYMQQLEGFAQKGKEDLVCRLKKSLYGLKQAPKQWYQKFDMFMQSQGFKRSDEDPCLYVQHLRDNQALMLILYIDDMLIVAGHDKNDIVNLQKRLCSQFDMKDLGNANHILSMRITQNRKQKLLYLSQKEYVHKVLERFSMQKGKSISTQLPTYLKLSKDNCPKIDEEKAFMEKVPYASVVGSLMYVMVATRRDLRLQVGVVSRFMSNLGRKNWYVIKTILRYMSGIADRKLCYSRGDLSISGYVDSDYVGCVDSRRSTTGWIFKFVVSWRSVL